MTKVKKINAITVRTRTDNSMKMLASSSDYILNMLHLKIITTPVISMRFSATGELTRLSNSKMFKPLITKRSISIASILFKKKNKYLVNWWNIISSIGIIRDFSCFQRQLYSMSFILKSVDMIIIGSLNWLNRKMKKIHKDHPKELLERNHHWEQMNHLDHILKMI